MAVRDLDYPVPDAVQIQNERYSLPHKAYNISTLYGFLFIDISLPPHLLVFTNYLPWAVVMDEGPISLGTIESCHEKFSS